MLCATGATSYEVVVDVEAEAGPAALAAVAAAVALNDAVGVVVLGGDRRQTYVCT